MASTAGNFINPADGELYQSVTPGLNSLRGQIGRNNFQQNRTMRGFMDHSPSPITPDLDRKTTDDDRSKSPPRPSILMQDSFNLSKEQFNKSVHFNAGKKNQQISEATSQKFWSKSQVNFNNQIMKMTDDDKVLVKELQNRIKI